MKRVADAKVISSAINVIEPSGKPEFRLFRFVFPKSEPYTSCASRLFPAFPI